MEEERRKEGIKHNERRKERKKEERNYNCG